MAYTGFSFEELANKFRGGIYSKAEVDALNTTQEVDLVASIGNINNPLLDLPLNNSLTMKQGVGSVTFTRASTATYVDRYGILQTAATDEARFEKEGLLVEGTSTNLFLQSEALNTVIANWSKSGLNHTVLNATIGPDGTVNGSKLEEVSIDNLSHYINAVTTDELVQGTTYTLSVFAKADERGYIKFLYSDVDNDINYVAWFNLVDGLVYDELNIAVGDATILPLANGWYRCSITFTSLYNAVLAKPRLLLSADGVNTTYVGTIGYGLFVYGMQFEELPFATSYIPTTTVAVTREEDICTVTAPNNVPAVNTLTILCDFNTLGYYSLNKVFMIDTSELLQLRLSLSGYRCDNPISDFVEFDPIAFYETTRMAMTVSNTEAAIFFNDIFNRNKIGTNAMWTTGSLIGIGCSTVGGTNLYGHIKNFRIYDQVLTTKEIAMA